MLSDIKKTLWATADKLRANVDAAEYKHLVLGLIFLKFISDSFAARRAELARRFADENDDYCLLDASAEGKKGGQFYTPASIVQTLVAVLAPHTGKVYDPCCGSGKSPWLRC